MEQRTHNSPRPELSVLTATTGLRLLVCVTRQGLRKPRAPSSGSATPCFSALCLRSEGQSHRLLPEQVNSPQGTSDITAPDGDWDSGMLGFSEAAPGNGDGCPGESRGLAAAQHGLPEPSWPCPLSPGLPSWPTHLHSLPSADPPPSPGVLSTSPLAELCSPESWVEWLVVGRQVPGWVPGLL